MRDRTSDREKLFITALSEILLTGNIENAQQTCEAWARTYPRDAQPHLMLSGHVNKAPGRYEHAAAEARKSIDLDPDLAIGYYNLAVNHLYLDRLGEAQNTLRRAAGRGLEIDEFVMLEYDLAFLRGDQEEMEREAARARARSGAENWISDREASTLAYSGHLQRARILSHRAVDQAEHAAQRERAGLWEATAAVREAFFGNAAEARTRAKAALELSRGREVEYGAAFALARAQDSSRSQTLAADLEARFAEDTSVRSSYLPALRARLALNHGDASKAVAILQAAVPQELGSPFFGALYPVYVRGEAYLVAHQGTQAATEFQKILDHRGIVVSDPIGACAFTARSGARFVWRYDQGEDCAPGFPYPLERRRPQHPDSQASQDGIRQAVEHGHPTVGSHSDPVWPITGVGIHSYPNIRSGPAKRRTDGPRGAPRCPRIGSNHGHLCKSVSRGKHEISGRARESAQFI